MCLRFGTDPRRDFLSTESPGQRTIAATKRKHVPAKAPGKADHSEHSEQGNCSYLMAAIFGTVMK